MCCFPCNVFSPVYFIAASRDHNGGLLDLVTLHRLVDRRRGSAADPVSLDDILQAIKKLEVPLLWTLSGCDSEYRQHSRA